MQRFILFLPVIIFLVLGFFLYRGLSVDPTKLPSALINRPFPMFTLPTVLNGDIKTERDLQGQVALVNVWATWCVSCKVEHAYLLKIQNTTKLPIYGINYKDNNAKAQRWLETYQNPFEFSLADQEGSLGIELGVYGAPETFIIDKNGRLQYRYAGVITEQIWQDELKPIIDKLKELD